MHNMQKIKDGNPGWDLKIQIRLIICQKEGKYILNHVFTIILNIFMNIFTFQKILLSVCHVLWFNRDLYECLHAEKISLCIVFENIYLCIKKSHHCNLLFFIIYEGKILLQFFLAWFVGSVCFLGWRSYLKRRSIIYFLNIIHEN